MSANHGNSRRVGIFIIAYNAAQTLISAYKRIPEDLKRKASEIYCFDDCSDDNTYYAGLGYKIANKIRPITHVRVFEKKLFFMRQSIADSP